MSFRTDIYTRKEQIMIPEYIFVTVTASDDNKDALKAEFDSYAAYSMGQLSTVPETQTVGKRYKMTMLISYYDAFGLAYALLDAGANQVHIHKP